MDWKDQFNKDITLRWDENTARIEKCLTLLTEEELWYQPNNETNSIANLILHLGGNIDQYISSGLGTHSIKRERAHEFSANNTMSKQSLFDHFLEVLERAKTTLSATSAQAMLQTYNIQGFTLSGMSAVIHVTEHYSYHIGQIALITKLIKDVDLGFYAGFDLDQS